MRGLISGPLVEAETRYFVFQTESTEVDIIKLLAYVGDKTVVYLYKYKSRLHFTDEIKLGLITYVQGKIVGRYLPSITV